MKKGFLFSAILLITMMLCASVFAADTAQWYQYENRGVGVAVLVWTDVAATGDGAVTAPAIKINGAIENVTTVPNSGATQPDDNYDITGYYSNAILSAALGTMDQFQSTLLNRDEANTETVRMNDGTYDYALQCPGTITFAITNAGVGNGGMLIVRYTYRQETR